MTRLAARAAFVAVALGLVIVGAIVVVAFGVGVPAPASPRPATPTAAIATATTAPTPSPSPSPSPSAAPAPSPSPSPLVSVRGNIVVERPSAAARVTSPLTAAGRARVFEAALVWRLVDVGGRELAKDFTTASMGAPEFGTFSFPIAFRVTAETSAYVEIFTNSPRDGSVDEIVRVSVTLLP